MFKIFRKKKLSPAKYSVEALVKSFKPFTVDPPLLIAKGEQMPPKTIYVSQEMQEASLGTIKAFPKEDGSWELRTYSVNAFRNKDADDWYVWQVEFLGGSGGVPSFATIDEALNAHAAYMEILEQRRENLARLPVVIYTPHD